MEILNLEVEEKTDFIKQIVYRDETTNLPIDLTDYSAIMEIRSSFGSDVILKTLTDSNEGLILGDEDGTIDIVLSANDTDMSQIPAAWERAAYDLIVVDGDGLRKKILKGFITIGRSASLS